MAIKEDMFLDVRTIDLTQTVCFFHGVGSKNPVAKTIGMI